MAKRKPNTQPFWRFMFLIYMGMMLWLLFGRSSGCGQDISYAQVLSGNINLKPLYTIKNYLNIVLHYPQADIFPHCGINLVGNVVMFIPAGWLLPRIFRTMRNFFLFLLTSLCAILLVEVVQLFSLLGSLDIDDLILNISGMIIGFIFWKSQNRK